MKLAKTVEEYFETKKEWMDALVLLRTLFQATSLDETLKWGMPTYVLKGKNVAGFNAFRSFVSIWFHQGAFLSDPLNVLVNAQEGVTKAQRQWRFHSAAEIDLHRKEIVLYIEEAIQNQQAGKMVMATRNKTLIIPPELGKAMAGDPSLKDSFENLTPGRQREYADYISSAKREETRLNRLEKIIPMIREGAGLMDKYR